MKSSSENCDLNRLHSLDGVYVKQQRTGFNANKYIVTTIDNKTLLSMEELPCPIPGVLVDAKVRSFRMNVYDTQREEVFWLHRPRTFGFAADRLEIFMRGEMVAIVRREVSIRAIFTICSPQDCPVYTLKGDIRNDSFRIKQVKYPVQTIDNRGFISKKFAGILQELFTSRDNYIISFPPDCTLEYKAAIIGTCIFIDYKYHEN